SRPSVAPLTLGSLPRRSGRSRSHFLRQNLAAGADFGVAARNVHDLAGLDLVEILLEPGDRRLLDELVRELVNRLDARLQQVVLRTAADLRHKHRVAVVDRADDRVERVVLPVAALAVKVHPAVTDELRASRREFPHLELLGMAEVLVDQARALR